MNDPFDLDPAEQEILTHDVSDEVLEAAAGTDRGGMPPPLVFTICVQFTAVCCQTKH